MSGRREDPDRDRMRRIETRDADALGELYDQHGGRLLSLAQRILGAGGDAEEVVQEVFLYAWRAAASFDPARGSVLTWLLIVTRSRAIDRLRARRPGSTTGAGSQARSLDDLGEILPSRDDVEADSQSREWESLCRAAVGELPPDQRRVLELAYFEGLTQEEIASKTATPLGTVKTRVRLGLMKLRERMRPYWESGSHGA
jgi:RNA polymerase sigma-70 factor, ECF subfamily